MPRRGGRRGSKGGLRGQVNNLTRRVGRMQIGQRFIFPRGRFDPPRVVTNPRWSFVLDTTIIQDAAGTQTVTDASIRTGVRGQLGLPNDFAGFELYYLRVDLWTTPTDVLSGQATLALRICDFDSGSYAQWIEDQGTVTRPGHVHAVWPRSQQVVPHSGGAINIFQVDSPGQFTGILHVHLQIAFSAGDVLPTLRRVLTSGFTPHPEVV